MFSVLKIALRFLKDSKIQTFIIVLGIAIGVSVQIFIGLLSKGLENTLLNKIVGNAANITIYSYEGGIQDWQSKKEKIAKMNNEIKDVAPVVDYQAFLKLNDMTEPVQIRGFIASDFNSMYDIKNKIYEGRVINSSEEILMGKDLKERLGLKLGEKVNIITINRKNMIFTVVGFYDLGVSKINKTWLIADLKTTQDLMGFGDKVTSIEIGVRDIYNADIAAKKLENTLADKSLKFENWKSQNKLLVSGIIGQKICSFIIQVFVLLAAVLSIISILGISVVQKYKQIGILKAMGIGDVSSAFIFLLEAFILGILGTALGLFFTWMYIKGFNRYIITSEGIPIINIIIKNDFIVKSALIDIGASTFAAFFPALKSFRLSPVDVIRNG